MRASSRLKTETDTSGVVHERDRLATRHSFCERTRRSRTIRPCGSRRNSKLDRSSDGGALPAGPSSELGAADLGVDQDFRCAERDLLVTVVLVNDGVSFPATDESAIHRERKRPSDNEAAEQR